MSIREAYNRWAETYDSDVNRTRDLDQTVTRALLAGERVSSILEIGCGTGKNTQFLADIGGRVHAVDFSAGMIANAQKNVRNKNVLFSVADITRPWPCYDRSVDIVVCNLVLEHVSDLSFVFGEAYRSLVVGGRFLMCELHPYRQYLGVRAKFQQRSGEVEIQAFVHHLSDYLTAAAQSGFALELLKEWWHEADEGKPPRLLSCIFTK